MIRLSYILEKMQRNLFPNLEEELGPMTDKEKNLIKILEIVQIEDKVYVSNNAEGRPPADRKAIARSFVAKAFYNLTTTKELIEKLKTNANFRRICGFTSKGDVPTESTFSRAFSEFSTSKLSELTHKDLVKEYLSKKLIGHISRDSTAIKAREKPAKKYKTLKKIKQKGRPKKGKKKKLKEETVLEKQSKQNLAEMLKDLSINCDVGCKKDSNGYKNSWKGYKLHIDTADNSVPISCILTSASTHDSQVALPLSLISEQRITNLYDLMDSAYDSLIIKKQSEKLGHKSIIDINPRRNSELKKKIAEENKKAKILKFKDANRLRYNERSTVERTNGRLKDEFCGRNIYFKGATKIMSHLMFGIVVLATDQLIRLVQ